MDRSKMDLHADTCVAGCNMVVLEDTGQTVSVTPFTSEYNALKGNPIVSAATTYDCPTDGETYLWIFNKCYSEENSYLCRSFVPINLELLGFLFVILLSNLMLNHRTISPSRI